MLSEHRDCSQQIISIRRVKMADQRFHAPMDNVCSNAEWLGSQTTDTKSRYQLSFFLAYTQAILVGTTSSNFSGHELAHSR
ncbi:hypothetical protein Y032_0350g3224 [Ancylostoma ceylanicum]|uniref:Uncharacterized protein n=1 Tax=Ancylostoma ceylanicum TaxID=53326 RepID=A0A016RWX4_9BILA|nr:hypothetical protein Y032_0350g3224 [Ancylostoma ceylanicum]